jgi:transposase
MCQEAVRKLCNPSESCHVRKVARLLARPLRRRRQTGDVKPRVIPGRPPRKGTLLKEWLPKHLETNDDLTLEEHREAFEEEFGEEVSTSTIGRAIARLPDGGWPLKKSPR